MTTHRPTFWVMEVLTTCKPCNGHGHSNIKGSGCVWCNGTGREWCAVRRSGAKHPYRYDTKNKAWSMLSMCYPDSVREEVRVTECYEITPGGLRRASDDSLVG